MREAEAGRGSYVGRVGVGVRGHRPYVEYTRRQRTVHDEHPWNVAMTGQKDNNGGLLIAITRPQFVQFLRFFQISKFAYLGNWSTGQTTA